MQDALEVDKRTHCQQQRLITLHRVMIEGVLAYEGQQWQTATDLFRQAMMDPAIQTASHEMKKRLVGRTIPAASLSWDQQEPSVHP